MDYSKLYNESSLSEAAREHRELYDEAVANALADDELVMRYEITDDCKKPKYKEPSAIAKYGLDRMGVVLNPDGATYVAYNPIDYRPNTEFMPVDRAQLRQFLRDLVDAV
jgi:glycosyltransferase involved in cell wall biosynthesis